MEKQDRSAVRNAADPEQVKKAEQSGRLQEQQDVSDMAWVLSDRRGRRAMWRMMEFCGMNKTSYRPHFGDMAFAEGSRNVGLMIQTKILKVSEEQYLLMQTESKEEHHG